MDYTVIDEDNEVSGTYEFKSIEPTNINIETLKKMIKDNLNKMINN